MYKNSNVKKFEISKNGQVSFLQQFFLMLKVIQYSYCAVFKVRTYLANNEYILVKKTICFKKRQCINIKFFTFYCLLKNVTDCKLRKKN